MISINWPTGVITIPQADLTHLSGANYELDVDWFRLQLKDLEDSEEGSVWPDTHRHATASTLSGVTYARQIEILDPYTITFQDVGTPYTVSCVGANHNIADVKNVNQVSLIIGNSAGLIMVDSSSAGVDVNAIASAVWDKLLADHTIDGSAGKALSTASSGGVDIQALVDGILDEPIAGHSTAGTVGKSIIDIESDVTTLMDIQAGNWKIVGTIMIFYKQTGEELFRYSLLGSNGLPNNENVFERVKL